MHSFMSGIISPFMACWQPPMSACVSPTSPYMRTPPAVTPNDDRNTASPPPTTPQETKNIRKPHAHDVLCGRGGSSNRHVGNLNFRGLVGANKDMYVTLTKKQKMMVARAIVNAVKRQEPPGRFLQKDPETGLWFDIGLPRSLEKTSQALREKTAADKNSAMSVTSQDDTEGSEPGSWSPGRKSTSNPSTPTSSAPNSPVTTPKSHSSTTEVPEITIPDHLEAQFNPHLARRRLSHPHYGRRPPPQPYLPHFSHPPPEDAYGSRPYPPPPPPYMYSHPHYMQHDRREYGMAIRRSQGPPTSRLPPPQPYPPMAPSSMIPPTPPSPVSSAGTPDYSYHSLPAVRAGLGKVSPGRRQEWKRRRTSESSASRVPDNDSSTSLSQDMESRLSIREISSPSQVLQSRSRRGLSEAGEMSGLAALAGAALLKLDEGK